MSKIVGDLAVELQKERNRSGTAGPVEAYLLTPVDAVHEKECRTLSQTLLQRVYSSLQDRIDRNIATIVIRKKVEDGNIVMRLDWTPVDPGYLELRTSFGRMAGDNIEGHFLEAASFRVATLPSDADRDCLGVAGTPPGFDCRKEWGVWDGVHGDRMYGCVQVTDNIPVSLQGCGSSQAKMIVTNHCSVPITVEMAMKGAIGYPNRKSDRINLAPGARSPEFAECYISGEYSVKVWIKRCDGVKGPDGVEGFKLMPMWRN